MSAHRDAVMRVLLAGMLGAVFILGCRDVHEPDPNVPPTAAFTVACADLTCQLSDSSSDRDGVILARTWNLGDGATSTEQNPVHTYAAPGGQFTVRLRVTDDDGDTTTAVKSVTVQLANAAPVAAFVASCANLTCTFTDQSSDPDVGDSVASRSWGFGDGQTSTERNPTYTYRHPGGRFIVTLSVTDRHGAGDTASWSVGAMPPAPDRGGVYERETPHRVAGRHSRYVIRNDGTFELRAGTGSDTTIYTGSWRFPCCWGGAIDPRVLIFDFDAFVDNFCGEAFGVFLLDGHMGVSYCGEGYRAGLEEGVYTTAPVPGTPGPPPPLTGQIAFVREGAIYLANVDGGGVLQLTNGSNDLAPAWSPDGSHIAFTRREGTTNGVYVMDAGGGNVVQLAAVGSDPTWSPDGARLAFICNSGLDRGICVRAIDDGAAPVMITRERGFVSDPAWSSDGTRIAFTSDWAMYDIWFDLWVVGTDGSQRTELTPHTAAALNPYEHYGAAWSPDGQRIAVARCVWAFSFCSSSAITVMNADGSGAVGLVAATGFASPTWSPDGRVIAYASANAIEWVSADGQQRGRILDSGHSPAWRP